MFGDGNRCHDSSRIGVHGEIRLSEFGTENVLNRVGGGFTQGIDAGFDFLTCGKLGDHLIENQSKLLVFSGRCSNDQSVADFVDPNAHAISQIFVNDCLHIDSIH